jgi:tRNA-dihydrouridine synthase
MSFETLMLWLTPDQVVVVSNTLQQVSNYLAEIWIECANQQSESKLKQQFMPALRWYLDSHPPRDDYERFLRVELFDVVQDIRNVSDAKHFWATLVELVREHTCIEC